MARHYRFCPLPCAAGGGEGWGGVGSYSLSGASGFAAYAASTGLVDGLESPCRAWLGTTASAPSLLRSKGEGWGGVGFCGLSGAAGFAAYAAPTGLVDGLESPCRAWLGTTASAPPFCVAKGRVGEGLALTAFQVPLASRLTPLLRGWWIAEKAPAEHGSALPLLPPPFCVAKGRVGEGLAFAAFQAPLASRLTPLLQGWWMAWKAPAEHGSALPLLPLPCAAGGGEGWGGVGFCGFSGAAGFAAYAAPTRLVDYWESPCRAWLGTTASAPSLAPQAEGRVGEGLAFVAFQRCWLRGLRRFYEAGGLLGKPLPSMARHYLSSLLLPRRLRALVGGSVLLRGHR